MDEAKLPNESDSIEHSDLVTLKEEASLRRKFDVFLLPPLALMLVIQPFFWNLKYYFELHRYLFNALDKGNVGNAKTAGWDKVSLLYFC